MALLPSTSSPDLSSPASFRSRPSRRMASAIGWRYSWIFVAALLAIALVRFTGIDLGNASTREMSFRVTDGATGAPLTGATVSLGGVATVTDGAGVARFRTGWQTQPVVVSVPGYALATSEVTRDSSEDHSVALVVDASATPGAP